MCCYLATEVCVQICTCSVLQVHVQCVLAVNGLLLELVNYFLRVKLLI